MTFGIGIATLRYYVPFLATTQGLNVIAKTDYKANATAVLTLSLLLISYLIFISNDKNDIIISWITGLLFGSGLGVGGMLRRDKILNFLTISDNWDPQLLILFMTAVGANIITFHHIIKKRKAPIYVAKFLLPTNNKIDLKLIAGSALFGVGWGITGLCPGPAMNLFTQFTLQISIVFIACLGVGQIVAAWLDTYYDRKITVSPNSNQ